MHDNALPALVDETRSALPVALTEAIEAAAAFARAGQAENTRRAYASDLADFAAWCRRVGLCPLPARPETVAAYLGHLGQGRALKASTIARRVAAIGDAHRRAGYDNPAGAGVVRQVLAGTRNALGTRPEKKAPLTADLVAKLLKRLPADGLIGLRDRALILIAFAGALRRSELVGIDLEHIERRPQGILIRIARSKGDQAGRGQTVAVPNGKKLRPVEALDAWTKAAGIRSGPLFRGVAKGGRVLEERLTGGQVARIVKQVAARAGLNADLFSGHSARSGFATTAGLRNVAASARHLRHAKLDTTMGYVADEGAFTDHAGQGFL